MKRLLTLFAVLGLAVCGTHAAKAVTLIGGSTNNGNMDLCVPDEITPGFFLPKPATWVYAGTRTITGAYRDGLSSEPWAGPAPTPVTTDGTLNPPPPEGCDGADCGVFFKAFTGNVATDGPATVSLSQTLPATAGTFYYMNGWAGAEANFLGTGQFEIQFLNAANAVIGGAALNLNTAGLLVPNGQPSTTRTTASRPMHRPALLRLRSWQSCSTALIILLAAARHSWLTI